MQLSAAELRLLLERDPSSPHILYQLRERVIQVLSKRMPRAIGTCAEHGRRIMIDDQGAMSTGYFYHVENSRGYERYVSNCDPGGPGGAYLPATWDEPSPYAKLVRAELDRLHAAQREYRRKSKGSARSVV